MFFELNYALLQVKFLKTIMHRNKEKLFSEFEVVVLKTMRLKFFPAKILKPINVIILSGNIRTHSLILILVENSHQHKLRQQLITMFIIYVGNKQFGNS